MIFLTIGTHEPFDRLVRAVDDWCAATGRGAEVFGQITDRAGYRPAHFETVDRLTPEAYRARCRDAALIVSHAGMGSIITALTYRTPIIVLPRRGHLRETRNDHQYATAQRLGSRPGIFIAMTEADLAPHLDRLAGGAEPGQTSEIGSYADRKLTDALRELIFR